MFPHCWLIDLAPRNQPSPCTPTARTEPAVANDPPFLHPTKPVGPHMKREHAEKHINNDGWKMAEENGRGWRRLVASPSPREIVELPLLKKLVAAGEIVIAAGGGGIPVVRDENGFYRGVE